MLSIIDSLRWLVALILVILAKFSGFLSRWFHYGSGTALPGYLIERYAKWVLTILTRNISEIIFISGTNGKTTTRAIINHIYTSNGIATISNLGGANIFRGVASAIINNTTWRLQPKHQTLVLEVEEATLPILCDYLCPQTLVLTNVFRDQLDAYGEIDKTLGYFRSAIQKTKPLVIVNADDHKLLECVYDYTGQIYGFSVDSPNKPKFELAKPTSINFTKIFWATNLKTEPERQIFDLSINNNQSYIVHTNLKGIYNVYNILAAIGCTYDKFGESVIKTLDTLTPVFGRGELISLGATTINLFLVKNPAGFDQVLTFLHQENQNKPINLVILINDQIADGRDVSWLWDIHLEEFLAKQPLKNLKTGGLRGLDMLLRCQQAGASVTPSDFLENSQTVIDFCKQQTEPVYILCTYTALLEFRKEINRLVKLKDIDSFGN